MAEQDPQTPFHSRRFLQATINSLSEHVVLLDGAGRIVAVNRAWRDFARDNGYADPTCGLGVNYLAECDAAAARGDQDAGRAATALRTLLYGEGETPESFELEYACHSRFEKRWFILSASRFVEEGRVWAVLSHKNITARKWQELHLEAWNYVRAMINHLGRGDTVAKLVLHFWQVLEILHIDYGRSAIHYLRSDNGPVSYWTGPHWAEEGQPTDAADKQRAEAVRRGANVVCLPDVTKAGEAHSPYLQEARWGTVRAVCEVPFSHGVWCLTDPQVGAWDANQLEAVKQAAAMLSLGCARLDDLQALSKSIDMLRKEINLRGLAQSQLRDFARHMIRMQEEERQRLERDLRACVEPALGNVADDLQALAGRLQSDDALAGSVEKSRRRLTEAIDKLTGLATALSPVVSRQQELGPALEQICRQVKADTGQSLQLHVAHLPAMETENVVALYRVVQEICNALKRMDWQSGRIALSSKGQQVHIEVDLQQVADPDPKQWEFVAAYARLLGGGSNAEPAPENALLLTVDLPRV